MTEPEEPDVDNQEAFAQGLGFTIGRHIREVESWIPDASVLGTNADLLRMMVYELGVQLNFAGIAVEKALEYKDPMKQPDEFWGQIQLVLTFTSTAANIIWTSPLRRKHLIAAFPDRAADVQLLLNIQETTRQYEDVIALRDTVIHIDEKLEQWWLDHPGKSLGMRSIGPAKRDGTDFLTWEPETQTLVYLKTELSLLDLHRQLVDLSDRSSRAFSYMLFVREVDDGEDEST